MNADLLVHWLMFVPIHGEYSFLSGNNRGEKNAILQKWVEITGVQGKYKIEALTIALHRRSWRWVNSESEAQRYATKYRSKATEVNREIVGKGRSVPIAEPKKLHLTAYQQVLLRKILRGWARKSQKKLTKKDRLFKKYQLTNRLKRNDFQGVHSYARLRDDSDHRVHKTTSGGKEERQEGMYGTGVRHIDGKIWIGNRKKYYLLSKAFVIFHQLR